MKQLFDLVEAGFNVGITITEVALTPIQIKDMFPEIQEGRNLESVVTPYGEVRIVCL